MSHFDWAPYFEPRGLGITLGLCALFLAIVLYISGQAMRWQLVGLRWATLGVGCASLGFLFNMLMGYISPVITIVGGLSMMLGGELLVLVGVRQLRNLPTYIKPLSVAWVAAVIFAFWFGVVEPHGRIRIGTMAFLLATLAWWVFITTWNEQRPGYKTGMRLVQLFSGTFAILMTIRFITIGILGISIPDNLSTNPINSLSVLAGGIALIGAIVGLVYLSVGDLVMRLRRLAERDPLTDLRNRRSLRDRLNQKAPFQQLIVAMLDLDHFKKFNDSQGHAAGDQLIRQISQFLHHLETEQTTHKITAYRMGGEEFSLLFLFHTNVDSTWALVWAEQLLGELKQEYLQQTQQTLSAGISIGTVAELDLVLRHADHALYQAKHSGRNRIAVYEAQS